MVLIFTPNYLGYWGFLDWSLSIIHLLSLILGPELVWDNHWLKDVSKKYPPRARNKPVPKVGRMWFFSINVLLFDTLLRRWYPITVIVNRSLVIPVGIILIHQQQK